MKKHIALIFAAILILSVIFGCSSSMADANWSKQSLSGGEAATGNSYEAPEAGYDRATPAPYPKPDEDRASDTGFSNALTPDPSRKLIWNGDIELETTDFEHSESALFSLIEECGGYIQSSAVTGEGRSASGEARLRNGRYTVRIPSDNFQLFMRSSGNVATILSSKTGSEDVTSYYFDTEARLKVLKIKEERLLEMLEQTEKAAYTDELKYILELENELSNVRYEIENLTGTLRRYDDLISYSTVTVYLSEVREFTATPVEPKNIGERISLLFSTSIKRVAKTSGDIIVWLVGNSPVLIILAALFFAVYFPVRLIVRRGKAKSKPAVPPQDEDKA